MSDSSCSDESVFESVLEKAEGLEGYQFEQKKNDEASRPCLIPERLLRSKATHTGIMDALVETWTLRQISVRRPIFGCIGVQEHDSSWQKSYQLWPYGVCSQFIKHGSHFDISEYINQTNKFIMDWPHPYEGYERTSWEHVATEEMWDAKASLGLKLLEEASVLDKSNKKQLLLQYSYDIYHKAMNTTQQFPVHWHKNLALVCEKLARVKPKDKKKFLAETVEEFKRFIELDQNDKDYDLIIDAVINLRQEMKHL